MNTVLRVCAALLALAGIVTSQTKPKDVDGWGKIKWGMTLADAKTACGSDCGEEAKVEVGDIKMTASLSATGIYPDKYVPSKPVSQIELTTVPSLDHRSELDVYEYLRSALTQKYGTPTSEYRKPDELNVMVTGAVWIFPSTTITLKLRHSGFLFLTYQRADKKAKDAL
jgi:hypothetical protein